MAKNDFIRNGAMPAMPIFNEEGFVSDAHSGALNGDGMGLTKREYFAGLAMQGLLCGGYCIDMPKNRAADVSGEAVVLADALLAELDK